jgi:hypothetical protein
MILQGTDEAVNPNEANGTDNISCGILKEAAESISPYLQLIFIKSIEEHNVPKDWLVVNVTALFKKGDTSQPVNYRPVSLTSPSVDIFRLGISGVPLSSICGKLSRSSFVNTDLNCSFNASAFPLLF